MCRTLPLGQDYKLDTADSVSICGEGATWPYSGTPRPDQQMPEGTLAVSDRSITPGAACQICQTAPVFHKPHKDPTTATWCRQAQGPCTPRPEARRAHTTTVDLNPRLSRQIVIYNFTKLTIGPFPKIIHRAYETESVVMLRNFGSEVPE